MVKLYPNGRSNLMSGLAYADGGDSCRSSLQRVVPEYWQGYSEDWLQGYDDAAKLLQWARAT